MNKTQRRWLMEEFLKECSSLIAKPGSDREKMLKSLQKTGIVDEYDAMFGNSYYYITDKGKKELMK